jgi:hypothetical protein
MNNSALVEAKSIVSAQIVYDLNFEIITSCQGIHLAHRVIHQSVGITELCKIKYEFMLKDHPRYDVFGLGRLK